MVPNVVVERADVPGGELVLYRRGDEWSIRVRRVELMNSRNHISEDELGRMTCARLAGRATPRLLVGGLGLGYTLCATLAALGARTTVVDDDPGLHAAQRARADLAAHGALPARTVWRCPASSIF